MTQFDVAVVDWVKCEFHIKLFQWLYKGTKNILIIKYSRVANWWNSPHPNAIRSAAARSLAGMTRTDKVNVVLNCPADEGLIEIFLDK